MAEDLNAARGARTPSPAPAGQRFFSGQRRWMVTGAAVSLAVLCGAGALMLARANAAPRVPDADPRESPSDTVRIVNIENAPDVVKSLEVV